MPGAVPSGNQEAGNEMCTPKNKTENVFPHVNDIGTGGASQKSAEASRGGVQGGGSNREAEILATAQSVRSRPRSSAGGYGHSREDAGGGGREGGGGRDESKLQFGNGPVLVVLFCGGVTHAETRLAYALSKVCLSRGAVGRVNGEGWDGRLRMWRLRM